MRLRFREQRHPALGASLLSARCGVRSLRLGHSAGRHRVPAEAGWKPGLRIFNRHQGFKEGREEKRGVKERKGGKGEKEKGKRQLPRPCTLTSRLGPFPWPRAGSQSPHPGSGAPSPAQPQPCPAAPRPPTDPTMETRAAATIR